MRSKTATRIFEETLQEVKDKARLRAKNILKINHKQKMKIKSQQKYKELLIAHYGFKECDFYEEDNVIYTTSKDNYMEKVRDVYENLLIELYEN